MGIGYLCVTAIDKITRSLFAAYTVSYQQSWPILLSSCHLDQTSRTLLLVRGLVTPESPEFRRFRLPIRCTMLLPTASTAPRGFIKLGPRWTSFSTLNNRMPVPFQTPTVPRSTIISDVQMNDQSNDSYQPSDNGDHSKLWILGEVGSIIVGRSDGGLSSLEDRSVRMVCRGSEGSQVSI